MFIKADKSLRAYYNEIDPFAAAWLRELAANGFITNGDIDERSIIDVRPSDLIGYDRVHLFAGIGVWDFALNQAQWSRRGIWTASCPCQPFSAAGAGAGFADERHLWPHAHYLIRECRPAVCVGEQVASKDADAWVDLVQDDMEAMDYAFGAVPFPSASVGAPHIRDRDYWMAYANDAEQRADLSGRNVGHGQDARWAQGSGDARAGRADGLLAYAQGNGHERAGQFGEPAGRHGAAHIGTIGRLADAGSGGSAARLPEPQQRQEGLSGEHDDSGGQRVGREAALAAIQLPGPVNGFWQNADWLFCRDGRWRPVEPGTFPLAHGAPARVGRLRGYGNAINAEQAQIFIETVIETLYPEVDHRPDDAIRLTGLSVSTTDTGLFA